MSPPSSAPSDRWFAPLALLAIVALALGCSEGQVSITQDGMSGGDVADGSSDGGADGGTSPTGTGTTTSTSGGDMTMSTTTTGSDTTGGGCADNERRCSVFTDNVETCVGGQWMESEVCSNGCQNNACLGMAVTGDCTTPVPIVVGQTIVSSTNTIYNPNTWSTECRSRDAMSTGNSRSPTGPETVFRLNVAQPQNLRVTVTPVTAGTVALYMRSECNDMGSEVNNTCKANAFPGAAFEIESFFGTGEYFLFVDDFGDSPGTFELKVEAIVSPACGGQIPASVDVSGGGTTTSGDTANGQSSEQWAISSSMCGSAMGTTGQENIWVFGLAEAANVNIAITPTSDPGANIGIYLREECESRLEDQIRCGLGPNGMTATWSGALDAGAYYLFVDSFTPSVTYEYNLEIQVN